jgi:hypothetical protein
VTQLSCNAISKLAARPKHSNIICPSIQKRKKCLSTNFTKTKFPATGLAELLNEDLSREYQAIIAYVVYSQEIRAAPNNSTSRSGDIRTSLARGR